MDAEQHMLSALVHALKLSELTQVQLFSLSLAACTAQTFSLDK